jgi:hypothetical protein
VFWKPRPDSAKGGAAVTIFSNGAAALAGLGAPLADPHGRDGFGGLIDRMQIRASDGARVLEVDLRMMRRRTGFPVVTVPRHRLIAHLASRLPDGVIQFNRAVAAVTSTATASPRSTNAATSTPPMSSSAPTGTDPPYGAAFSATGRRWTSDGRRGRVSRRSFPIWLPARPACSSSVTPGSSA